MKHFDYLPQQMIQDIFYIAPSEVSKDSPRELLSYSLGATLYMPGTRLQISNDVLTGKHAGLISLILCLEDSISDLEVQTAEKNVVKQLKDIADAISIDQFSLKDLPLIYIRVRNPKQIKQLVSELEQAVHLLSGFVFPKFGPENGIEFLDGLNEVNQKNELKLYGLPILESKEIIYKESRLDSLLAIKSLLDHHYESILNIRIGATDFSGLFGIRRNSDTTIYDVTVIRDCMTDIINVFGRAEKEYVISGPVWEYFNGSERILKPQIRQTPFKKVHGRTGLEWRSELIDRYEDALIQEILMDKSNGIVGKTIIHPSHIQIVQALNVVTHEEYTDALAIINSFDSHNGVMRSHYSNKMNEAKPHYHWARKTLLKSKVYGVFHEQQTFIDLLQHKDGGLI